MQASAMLDVFFDAPLLFLRVGNNPEPYAFPLKRRPGSLLLIDGKMH
jgi:hypothetical protein